MSNPTNRFIQAIINRKNICLTGGGGVGKTWHINKVKELDTKTPTAYLATTGLAASHMGDGAMTVHRFFGANSFMDKSSVQSLAKNSSDFKATLAMIASYKRIVIDESSMLRSDLFDLCNYIAQTAFDRFNIPFGGLQVILVGDFYQLPPVVKDSERKKCPNPWVFEADTWNDCDFQIIELTKVHRTNNIDLINCLNEVRKGEIGNKSYELLLSRVDAPLGVRPLFLSSVNKKVDAINSYELEKHVGEAHSFSAITWAKYPKYFRQLESEELTPMELELKKGCRVMITKNENCKEPTYFNGSMGVYLGTIKATPENATIPIEQLCVVVKLDNGKEITLPKVTMGILNQNFNQKEFDRNWHDILNDDNDEDGYHIRNTYPHLTPPQKRQILLRRKRYNAFMMQYPVKLGYALSIHKAQGMSLDNVCVDFEKIFAAGQAYVGLSRAKTLEGLTIKNLDPSKIFADGKAKSFYRWL